MKRNFLLLSFLLPAFYSVAQNALLKGIVRDAVNREIIPGVNIFDSKDKSVATVSDENGNFALQFTPGKHSVTCSFVGMKSETAEIDFGEGEKVDEAGFKALIREAVALNGHKK